MPPKASDSAFTGTINGIKPTESDTKIICALMENLTAPIQVDMEGAAKSAGMKNKNTFRVMLSRFRAKYNLPGAENTKTTTVASAASGGAAAADDDGIAASALETPIKKTPSTRKKKPVACEGDAGPLLTPTATTTTPGMASLSMADTPNEPDLEQPDTPSKPPPTTMTTAGRKRAADADPEGTPAKKKSAPARKPRITAQQKHGLAAKKAADWAEAEAEAQAIVTAAEAAVAAGWKIGDPHSPPYGQARANMLAAGAATADGAAAADNAGGGDTTMTMDGMECIEEHGSEAAEALALALDINAVEAEAYAVVDGSSRVN